MKEDVVVSHFKNYLQKEKWQIENAIPSAHLSNSAYSYIPDILAHKGEDILVGEAKGSEGLRELQTAIGQAITYRHYGANIIVVIVPEDFGNVAKDILQPINFADNGKIGLFVVGNSGSVREEIAYKRITLSKSEKEKGKEKLSTLAFIRDLRVQELKRLIEKIYLLKRKYHSGAELYYTLKPRDKDYIFSEQSTRGKLTQRSFTNTLITTNNIGLTENGKLTPLGISLALTIRNESEERFQLQLLNLLLKKGNYLQILRELNFITEKRKISFDRALPKVVEKLKKRKLLTEKIVSIEDYTSRMKQNQLKWLQELDVITKDNKINWHLVCDALSI
ncbi:MAG: hypothetical protein AB1521_16980 [Bacteroidota bacterium]